MNIEIKKLMPNMAEEYVRFFDETPHSDEVPEHRCYCVCWASTNTEEEECKTAELRRNLAIEYIKKGYLQGYLAYCNGEFAGWVNTNIKTECYNCRSWKMFMSDVKRDDDRVKSIFCFTIVPKFRGMGVATKLLDKIVEDARIEGFEYIEAYPISEFSGIESAYGGPKRMYEKAEFVETYKIKTNFGEDMVVMRKKI